MKSFTLVNAKSGRQVHNKSSRKTVVHKGWLTHILECRQRQVFGSVPATVLFQYHISVSLAMFGVFWCHMLFQSPFDVRTHDFRHCIHSCGLHKTLRARKPILILTCTTMHCTLVSYTFLMIVWLEKIALKQTIINTNSNILLTVLPALVIKI